MLPDRARAWSLLALLVVLTASCKDDHDRPTDNPPPPPPPSATAKAGACASGGGAVGDPVSTEFFPRTIDGYCLDPQGGTKTYGEKGKLSMDDVCTSALDGECEVYKRFGLVRMVALRYVDGGASGGSVEVYLSQFKDVPGSYGMFTKRVVADGDPADPSAPRVLAAGGAGAMGTGRAYVWRGPYVLELQYNNEEESPEQLAKSSATLLSAIGKAVGERLPGAADKPEAARRLPGASLLPGGIAYVTKDALDVHGAGAAAIGYYKDGERRWRAISFDGSDIAAAKDAMNAFRSRPGSLPIAGLGDEALQVVVQSSKDAPKTEWLLVRKGGVVTGVGDEEIALRADPQHDASLRLTKDEAVAKMKAWLGQADVPQPAQSATKK
jgi:hypothetical protein